MPKRSCQNVDPTTRSGKKRGFRTCNPSVDETKEPRRKRGLLIFQVKMRIYSQFGADLEKCKIFACTLPEDERRVFKALVFSDMTVTEERTVCGKLIQEERLLANKDLACVLGMHNKEIPVHLSRILGKLDELTSRLSDFARL